MSPFLSWWTPLAFGLLLAVLLLVPLPKGGRGVGALGDALHSPAFAVMGFLVCRTMLNRTGRSRLVAVCITFVALTALGAAAEVGQRYVGRGPSVRDAVADGLGALAGALWVVASRKAPQPHRFTLRAAAAAMIVFGVVPATLALADTVIQAREFPLIGSFEQPLEMLRWQTSHSRIRRDSQHATDGDWSLRVDLRPGRRPGVATRACRPDWSGYHELVLDIELDEGPPLDWFVTIVDELPNGTDGNRFERRIRLQSGWQQVVIPLADVERGSDDGPLDLRQIGLVFLLTADLKEPRTVFLDNIRLR